MVPLHLEKEVTMSEGLFIRFTCDKEECESDLLVHVTKREHLASRDRQVYESFRNAGWFVGTVECRTALATNAQPTQVAWSACKVEHIDMAIQHVVETNEARRKNKGE